ncbi:prephenate dehydrogenase [Mycobacterium tuberculosis CAS/NITR204]|uniref:Prephenate dehydrogenase n=1 Tax=Mycobacterium tuberculosis CAS/NITR204 TaxID=1310114 RepID=R4MK50_MYCTX|nr:prephenate dehydrogenase [Mycobacterium tuberculosis CAS/NITR204]
MWSMVMTLALDCGAMVVPAKSDEHDAAAAAVSHLPHLLARRSPSLRPSRTTCLRVGCMVFSTMPPGWQPPLLT